LLFAALAAAPAQADQANDILARTLSAISAGSPQSTTGTSESGAPAGGQAAPAPQQQNSATSTQTAGATGGAGGSATGGTSGTSQTPDGSQGGNAEANGGTAKAQNNLQNEQTNRVSGQHGSGSGGNGADNGGADVFVLDTAKSRDSRGLGGRRNDARPAGVSELSAENGARRPVDKQPRGDGAAKVLPPDGGLPGHGRQLPDQDSFFSVLSGSGGSGAGLMMLLLATLGASIALPRDRFKPFRTPAVTWRPSAYVPPIELPG
jgi:hypothetical protein